MSVRRWYDAKPIAIPLMGLDWGIRKTFYVIGFVVTMVGLWIKYQLTEDSRWWQGCLSGSAIVWLSVDRWFLAALNFALMVLVAFVYVPWETGSIWKDDAHPVSLTRGRQRDTIDSQDDNDEE